MSEGNTEDLLRQLVGLLAEGQRKANDRRQKDEEYRATVLENSKATTARLAQQQDMRKKLDDVTAKAETRIQEEREYRAAVLAKLDSIAGLLGQLTERR